MRKGFLYVVAIMGWYSRKVLAWRLSNSLDVMPCIEVLEETLGKHGMPDNFNSDQGSQFNRMDLPMCSKSTTFRSAWMARVAGWTMCLSNCLWRSLKYEKVYLKAYDSVAQVQQPIGECMNFYNQDR